MQRGGVLVVFSAGVYGLLFRVLHERVDDRRRTVGAFNPAGSRPVEVMPV